jgi:hypothetical protein
MTRDSGCTDGDLDHHDWRPISFRFETQLLDHRGRVQVRQPDTDGARVYFVCLKCRGWTYGVFDWVGFYLGDSDPVSVPPARPIPLAGPDHVLQPGEPTLDLLEQRGGFIRNTPRHTSTHCDMPPGEDGDIWECPECGRRWQCRWRSGTGKWWLLWRWPRNWVWWR